MKSVGLGVLGAAVTAAGVATFRSGMFAARHQKHDDFVDSFQDKINAERKMAETQQGAILGG